MATKASTRQTQRKTSPKASSNTTLIHETNDKGLHRIVLIKDGTAKQGDWADPRNLAILENYRAASGHLAEILSANIFTIKPIEGTVKLPS